MIKAENQKKRKPFTAQDTIPYKEIYKEIYKKLIRKHIRKHITKQSGLNAAYIKDGKDL